jgi:hypothetical protein
MNVFESPQLIGTCPDDSRRSINRAFLVDSNVNQNYQRTMQYCFLDGTLRQKELEANFLLYRQSVIANFQKYVGEYR